MPSESLPSDNTGTPHKCFPGTLNFSSCLGKTNKPACPGIFPDMIPQVFRKGLLFRLNYQGPHLPPPVHRDIRAKGLSGSLSRAFLWRLLRLTGLQYFHFSPSLQPAIQSDFHGFSYGCDPDPLIRSIRPVRNNTALYRLFPPVQGPLFSEPHLVFRPAGILCIYPQQKGRTLLTFPGMIPPMWNSP